MSLSIPYESVEDATMRLVGTIVLYDGEPVYINNLSLPEANDPKEDIFRVIATQLPIKPDPENKNVLMRKFISSRKFDMAPFPMGFMNYEGDVLYCVREPRRQQRQGLSNGTLGIQCVSNRNGNYPRWEYILGLSEFVDCVKGIYPSFAEAMQTLADNPDGGIDGVAFSRHFAAVRDEDISELIYLFHKTTKVGFIMEGKLKLAKKGKCLIESLREVGVPC